MGFFKTYWKWILLAVVAYVVYRIASNALESKDNETVQVNVPGETPENFNLFVYKPDSVDRKKKFGVGSSNSQEVAYLQTWLNLYYKSLLKVDGNWGGRTSAAFLMAKPLISPLGVSLDSLSI